MFERFTDHARRVVVLAQEEARLLDHRYIGTEHLVLGLCAGGATDIADGVDSGVRLVMERSGMTVDGVRTDVEALVGRGGDGPPSGHMPFTPGAKKALEMSLRAALRLGHDYIGAEHIMLGVLSDSDEVGAQLLIAQGTTAEEIGEVLGANIVEASSSATSLPSMIGSRPPRLLPCRHPDSELVWSPLTVPGPTPEQGRPMIVVRCQACRRALSILDADARADDPLSDG